jgi:uncharacterized lipoprotein YajG
MQMNKNVVCLTFAVLMLAGCSTPADTGDGTAAAESDRECRPVSGATGSRMRQSVCMTTEEWALADAEAKEREDIQSEFFRRVGENATQQPGPSFDSPAAAGF